MGISEEDQQSSTVSLSTSPSQTLSYPPSYTSISPEDYALYSYEEPADQRTLVDIFNTSTENYPTATAIDNGTTRLSYTELTRHVSVLAARLQDAGVGPGDRVGIRVTSGTTELYIGVLAILFAGASYVPVDVDDPDERATLVWSEAAVCAVITDDNTITMQDTKPIGSTDSKRLCPDSDAWVIFTSGSTGKPKGVAVTHRSAAAFVDAEAHLFLPKKPLAPGDRVLAGLSVAFDASCEEMWLAWRHGACLVPASRALVKAGAELGTFLMAQNISVVSTVPTLAALWPTEALRGLRLLILGGEACSPELASRLAGAVGSVWNTYGPTEATVVSCGAPLTAGDQVVRIGLPLAGWKLAVVGADGNPVRWGEEGELVIGGVGMARYLDLEKDKVKFTPSPAFGGERAYSSGDLVRAEKEGLVFIGRNDEQIKLGGRRIELGEVDAAMMTLPGVKGAASAIRKTDTGNQVLVGYIVRDKDASASYDRVFLKKVLPPTLIPMLVTVDSIPVRTSGKVDRKALPWPPPESSSLAAQGGTMAWVSDQWCAVIGASGASPESNFFELGGTSLAAAQLVSQLRQKCHTLSVADVYEHPTLAAMSDCIDNLMGAAIVEREVKLSPRWIIVVQSLVLAAVFLLEGLRLMAPLVLSKKIFQLRLAPGSWAEDHDLNWATVIILWVILVTAPGRLATTAVIVRTLTVGIRPGDYPRAGLTHLRVWAAERFVGVARLGAIAGTNWGRYYAWLMGCSIGRDVQLHALAPVTGLASFGDGCAIEPEADIAGHWVDGDTVHIGSITVGEGARVGARTMLMPNTVVEAFATVEPGLSVQGVIESPPPSASSSEQGSSHDGTFTPTRGSFGIGILYTIALLMLDFLPIIMFAPIWGLMPIVVKDYNDFDQLCMGVVIMTAPGTVIGFVLYTLVIVGIVRLASLAIRPGSFSWNSMAAFCAWLIHFLMIDVRASMFPIFASLFTPIWLRLLGSRIGRNVESSTVVPIPSLLTVNDNAFLADDVLIAPFELGAGRIRLGTVEVGNKTFLGNSAIVDPGVFVPDNSLIGVLGSAPNRGIDEKEIPAGSSWLGRPPISLPRKVDTNIDQSLTFSPPKKLVVARALIETCRIIALVINGFIPAMASLGTLWSMWRFGNSFAILFAAAFTICGAVAASIIAIVAKWFLTPNVKPGNTHPLWSSFVWRNELADSFLQAMALPLMIRYFYGTPVLSMFFRALGAKVGRGAWIESHLLPEADLCIIGDGATINRGSLMQTHLFHDRLMRLDKVQLCNGATLGPLSASLPGTIIGAGSTVYPVSLVMRGEHLPGSTRWRGNPVRPWSEASEDVKSGKNSRMPSWDAPSPV